jgi:hypothetical protein
VHEMDEVDKEFLLLEIAIKQNENYSGNKETE